MHIEPGLGCRLRRYFASGRLWPLGVVAIVYSLVGAPVAEELLFRGLVQRTLLARGVRPPLAIAASSLLFGADHYLLATRDPFALAGYVGVGVAFGFVAWYGGRLGPTMAGHGLYNATVDLSRLLLG